MSRLLALASSLVLLLGSAADDGRGRGADPARHDPLPDAIAAVQARQADHRVRAQGQGPHEPGVGPRAAACRRPPQRRPVGRRRPRAAPPPRRAQLRRVKAQHKVFIANAKRIDAKVRVLGETQRATNLVSLRIDASKIAKLATDPNVISISPVIDYEKALDETVPYIGAKAVQTAGVTGKGVRVGVIDSGIDYTHVAFGGAGHGGRLRGGLRHEHRRLAQRDARRPLPDDQGRRRLRLRRRELARRRRDRGSGSGSDRLRGSRHARRRHHRRCRRASPRASSSTR